MGFSRRSRTEPAPPTRNGRWHTKFAPTLSGNAHFATRGELREQRAVVWARCARSCGETRCRCGERLEELLRGGQSAQEGVAEGLDLIGVDLDDKAATTLKRDAHDVAATLLDDL